MSTPQGEPARDEVAAPTVSTAPAEGSANPPPTGRWHWKALPDHLGRARTSTVILSVLFLAIGTLYLNVRPDEQPVGTTPAGGNSDVEAPVRPTQPTEPAAPETTREPEPTTDPEEPSEAPTTGRTPGTTSPPSEQTTEPTTPTGTSGPTTGTTDPEEPAPTSVPAP